jgi:predicted metal-dependent hydrolase
MMQIHLGDLSVDVVHKRIKNVHLSVYPPSGRVRIAAPLQMKADTIRVFAVSKLGWIKQQQRKLREQVRETPREYVDRESHYLWGERYLLKIVEANAAPSISRKHRTLVLSVRDGKDVERKRQALNEWYRETLRQEAKLFIDQWSQIVGVEVRGLFIQSMKTKWGSANHRTSTIRLNTELAKKPKECLEYLVVHEMVHLLEPTHNERFQSLMDQFMPAWRVHRQALNRLPVKHEQWSY